MKIKQNDNPAKLSSGSIWVNGASLPIMLPIAIVVGCIIGAVYGIWKAIEGIFWNMNNRKCGEWLFIKPRKENVISNPEHTHVENIQNPEYKKHGRITITKT